MKKKGLKVISLVLAMVMLLCSSIVVFAESPYTNLISIIRDGVSHPDPDLSATRSLDFSKSYYDLQGGGKALYTGLINPSFTGDSGGNLFSAQFEMLTPKAKEQFLGDILSIANQESYKTMHNPDKVDPTVAITDDTVNSLLRQIQQEAGVGSTLLSTLMSNTKPDYVSANRLYQPFSGTVGTILGIISILLMALLGITMALDLCYINIPVFQNMVGDGKSTGNGKDGGSGATFSALVSKEAQQAVQANADGQGNNGTNKNATLEYFKKRVIGLLVLGICLLYLVQGQIFGLVGRLIDLMSGFLGV